MRARTTSFRPRVALVIAAYNEDGRDRGASSRTRSRSTTRASCLRIVVASDASSDGTDEIVRALRRPRRRARARARAAARSTPRTHAVRDARRDVDVVAFSDANCDVGAGRAAPARARRSPTPTSPTSAGGCSCARAEGTNQEGAYWRYEIWLRARESRDAARSRAATARSTPCAASATRRSTRASGHDLSFPYLMVKRGCRAVYAPRRRRAREADDRPRGRVPAQGAHVRPLLAARLPRPHVQPAPLGPLYWVADDLAPPAALRAAASCTSCCSRPRSCWRSAEGGVYCGRARRCRSLFGAAACCVSIALRGPGAGARAAALLPAGHAGPRVLALGRRLTRGVPAGVGARGGHAMSAEAERVKRAIDVVGAAAGLALARAGAGRSRRCAIKLEDGGPVLFRQDAPRARRRRAFEVLKLRTMVVDAETAGRRLRGRRRATPRITRVGDAAAAHVARRAAAALERAARRHEPRRPAPDRCATRSSATTSASAAASRCAPGLTGWAQVHGRASPALERAHRARRLVRRAPLAGARPAHPGAHGRRAAAPRGRLQGRDRRLGRPGREGRRVNVLLTCVGLRVDVVQAFRDAVERRGEGGVVVGTDMQELAPAAHFCDRFERMPIATDPTYADRLLELAERHDVRCVVPCSEFDLIVAGRHAPRASARSAPRSSSPIPTPTRRTVDKLEMARFLDAQRHPLAAHLRARRAARRPALPGAREDARGDGLEPHPPLHGPPRARVLPRLRAGRPRWCRRCAAARSSRSTSCATSTGAAWRPSRAP